MTMDVYGHLIAANLWESAERLGGTTGAPQGNEAKPGPRGEGRHGL
jgi:hypothetical protein